MLIVIAAATWCFGLYAGDGSLSIWTGKFAPGDPYGSGKIFQEVSWHLGIGTRTWGETYTLRVRHHYVSLQVKHRNRLITPAEAKEED
jgi:hypothetical protein